MIDDQAVHGIQSAAKLSKMSPDLIRMWERRYEAVSPRRTSTQRRLYSDADVERLILLGRLVKKGHAIGNIARLETDNLRGLLKQHEDSTKDAKEPSHPATGSREVYTDVAPSQALLEPAIEAILEYDEKSLEAFLEASLLRDGFRKALITTIGPLIQKIGEFWADGTFRVAHERLASGVLESFLVNRSKPFVMQEQAPTIVVGAPSGQHHELGALMAAGIARSLGWRIVYLGAGVPTEEIAAAAEANRAEVIALSLVYPITDESLLDDIRRLEGDVPRETEIIVGGRAAKGVIELIGETRLRPIDGFDQLESFLAEREQA